MAKCGNSQFILKNISLNMVSDVNDRFYCSICSNVLNDPIQTTCGCSFCRYCLTKYLLGESKKCPGNTDLCDVINFKEDVISDQATKREIKNFIVRCPFELCNIQCKIGEIEAHMAFCEQAPNMERTTDIAEGEQRRLQTSKLKEDSGECSFCGVAMTTLLLETVHHNYDHTDLCEKYVDYCPNVCGEAEKVCWKSHAGTCAVAILSCPYERFGCETKCRKMEMTKHLVEGAQKHAEELLKYIDHLGNEMTTMKTEMQKIGGYKKHSSNIERDVMPLLCQIKSIEDRMEDIAAKVTFYDGNFRWTMTNYFLDQRGSRLSPSFYTDERGYRMQLEISTDNQYGFLSVYAKIYPGKFDDELRWPFDKIVTIRILDQNRRGRHYAKLVYFDKSPKKCRKKPNMTSNHGYGEPAFIHLDELASKKHLFLDGRIWIDCFIDNSD